MYRFTLPKLIAVCAPLLCAPAAQAQLPNPYGSPITLEAAKRATAAAVAKARENNWLVAVAVVDPSGNLVHFEKMDGTQNGSSVVAIDKARTAALFKRPSKAFQDVLAAGGEGRCGSFNSRAWSPSTEECRYSSTERLSVPLASPAGPARRMANAHKPERTS